MKEWYVKLLMKMLQEEAEDHEELTAPLLVVCSATKDAFKQRACQTYTYQVVGGVQRFTAICRINEGEGCRKITARPIDRGHSDNCPAAQPLQSNSEDNHFP